MIFLLKALSLYLVPIVTFFMCMLLYVNLYAGKSGIEFFTEGKASVLLVISFFLSSILTYNTVDVFFLDREIMSNIYFYFLIVLSVLSWIVELVIVTFGILIFNNKI